jgi:putative transposase
MEPIDQKSKMEALYQYAHQQIESGRKVTEVLDRLNIPKSTYYDWIKQGEHPRMAPQQARRGSEALAPFEEKLINDTLQMFPGLRHRQIQGLIQNAGHYLSPSSIYRYLKGKNLIEDFERRPSPSKQATYSLFRKNMLWHLDWTKIRIGENLFQFIAIIDGFSKKIMAWDVYKNIHSKNVVDLYMIAVTDEGLHSQLPALRVDRGSPNTSNFTLRELKEMGVRITFAQVRRPTENAFIERFFGTLKQEEVYLSDFYPDEDTAFKSLDNFIFYYNEIRPHQANYNFTPKKCHDVNNRTVLKCELEQLKEKSMEKRKEYNAVKSDYEFIKSWKNVDGQVDLVF